MSPKKIATIVSLVAISIAAVIFLADAIRCVPPCV